jgi:hypothetical protein
MNQCSDQGVHVFGEGGSNYHHPKKRKLKKNFAGIF